MPNRPETQDMVVEAIKATPALAMTGITLNEIVALATLIYILLQVAYLIRKWWREETRWGRELRRWASKHGLSKPMELEPEE